MALSSDSNLRHVSHNSLSQPTRHDLMPDPLQPFNASSNQTISPAVLAATGNFDQHMQWTGPIQDSNPTYDEGQFNSNYSEFQPNYSVPARVSMPIPSTTNHAPLPSRLHKSQPPLTNSVASTAAAFILRQKLIGTVQDLNRDSMQTLSSYNSVDTDTTLVTRPSSTSTLPSQVSQPPRKLPPQRTMSSAFSSKKTHRRISSTGSSSSSTPAPRIPCTVPSCSTTFGRPSDRDRHMSSQHDTNSGFTCLLHTCSKFCPDNCSNKEHTRPPLSGSRQDKMKEHLEKVHGRKLKTMNDVPAAFENGSHFEREKRGWRCVACGKWLGSWWDEGLDGEAGGKQMIQRHASGSCFGGSMTVGNGEDELELQTALKRLSVEDPLARNGLGLGMGLGMHKALPRKPVVDTPEMRAWMAGYIHDVDAERDLH